ncbi:MAG: phosphate acyltransferase PlsX [Thermoanaerobacteraceae bacterium]|nr:phosphate acyltransferase PlsX [Thermoanaerobacteraceae bacterium]
MKIGIDAMGGDYAPKEIISGSLMALEEYDDIELTFFGDEVQIVSEINAHNLKSNNRIEIIHTDEVISNNDAPVAAIRNKKNSSLSRGLDYLKTNKIDVFVSAGNTGALMAGGLLKLGRIRGVDRPALVSTLPTVSGLVVLVDSGSNTDCRPINLLQFAVMGSVYAEDILNVRKPRIGLLNIGSEEEKGNELAKQTYGLLKEIPLNFIGNVEGRDVPYGKCDVLVCDGFVGNAVLKSMEGIASLIIDMLKEEMMKNYLTRVGALLLKDGLKNILKKMDYKEYGGAPLLGIDGVIIKAHGNSDARAFLNAIRQARTFVDHDVLNHIRNQVSGIGVN